MSDPGDDLLRELGKSLPYDRPDAERREGVRAALLVRASEGEAPPTTRRWLLAGGGFAAGIAAAAAVVFLIGRERVATTVAPEHRAQIEASAAAELEHTVATSATGTEEIVRVHTGRVRLAMGATSPGRRVLVKTGNAEIDGAGAYEITVSHDVLAAVTVTAGKVTIKVDGQHAVFLAAGQTWTSPIITADLTPAQATANAVGVGTGDAIGNGTENGTGTGNGIGNGLRNGTVNGIGIGNGNGNGIGIGIGTGNAIGNGTATGIRTGNGTGNAIGTGTGNANGNGTGTGNGIGTGNGTGTGTGNAIGNGAGTGNGIRTGNGTGTGNGIGTGNSNGNGTATGNNGTGSGAGPGIAVGNGTANGNGIGSGNGTRTVIANGTSAGGRDGDGSGTKVATNPATGGTAAKPAIHATTGPKGETGAGEGASVAPTAEPHPAVTAPDPHAATETPAKPATKPGKSPTEQHFERGWTLLRAKMFAEAAIELGAAADTGEGDLAADARYFQATALVKAGRKTEAEHAYVAFIDRAPKSLRRGRAAIALARLIIERGDRASARAWFESALTDSDPSIVAAAKAGLAGH